MYDFLPEYVRVGFLKALRKDEPISWWRLYDWFSEFKRKYRFMSSYQSAQWSAFFHYVIRNVKIELLSLGSRMSAQLSSTVQFRKTADNRRYTLAIQTNFEYTVCVIKALPLSDSWFLSCKPNREVLLWLVAWWGRGGKRRVDFAFRFFFAIYWILSIEIVTAVFYLGYTIWPTGTKSGPSCSYCFAIHLSYFNQQCKK